MAIGSTDNLITKVLNHFFRNSSQTPAGTLYMSLFTVAPDLDGTGGTEVSAGDYGRQTIAFGSPSGSPPAVQNSGTVQFTAGASSAWGTVVAFGIHTAVTGGDMLFTEAVNPNIVVGSGTPVSFAAGEVTIGGAPDS